MGVNRECYGTAWPDGHSIYNHVHDVWFYAKRKGKALKSIK